MNISYHGKQVDFVKNVEPLFLDIRK